jgi:4-hydroxy-3-methylbut-2-enyl diphosphate reductase
VDSVIEALRRLGPLEVSVLDGTEENITFNLPQVLRIPDTAAQSAA